MRARQFRAYLNSLRAPVAAMAGLPVESVLVFAQQDLGAFIGKAIAVGKCAVQLGITDWSSKAEARVPGPPLDVSLEVAVWTPEVVMDEGPTTLDVAEHIVFGLHGRKPPEGAAGLALIPRFKHATLTTQMSRSEQTRYLVATLTFEFPIALRSLSAPD